MRSELVLLVAVILAAVASSSGCALTKKSQSIVVRYYTPARMTPGTVPAQVAGPAPAAPVRGLELRLARVGSASYLKEKIAFRDADHEVGFYETLRWTEDPEAYVERALARALFEERRVHEVVSGAAPTLDVEISAFEELRTPRHVARIEVTWKLRDGRTVLRQRSFAIERPIAKVARSAAHGGALAAAMGEALDEVVSAVVEDVVAELARVSDRAAAEEEAAAGAP